MYGAPSIDRGRRKGVTTITSLVVALVALLLVSVQPAGAAPDDKSYTVGADLDRACTSDTVILTFTFMNTSTTATQKVRGALVTAPAGYTVSSAATPVASGGQVWASSVSGNTVSVTADNAATGLDEGILPGETVAVAVTMVTPSTAGSTVFQTQADQNSNFGGEGNAFVRIGAEPTVKVVDCELVLSATSDPVSAGASVTIAADVVDSADPGAGSVASFFGTLDYSVSSATAGCAYPASGTAAISSGEGSFALLALSGIEPDDLCTVDGSVKSLSDSETFVIDGSAALCNQGQGLCTTDTEFSNVDGAFAAVLCLDCKAETLLVANYLENGCIDEDCIAIWLADSHTLDVPFFIDVTVNVPRGQGTVFVELEDGTFQDLVGCNRSAPPCIYAVFGSGPTTWRVLLATDPPIGVR
jgi:hypothetical protein